MEGKRSFTIFGLSIWRVMAYFIIYSFIGYVIETLFGFLTMGILESRQSFLYGPFCGIYGIGAVLMIIAMQRVPRKYGWLFIAGFMVGSITEYVISWASEKFAGITWWDYSYLPFNINGRICLLYSIFWGFLAIFLIKVFNPILDRFMNWIKGKVSIRFTKGVVLSVFIFIVLEFLATAFAIQAFLVRMEILHDLNIPNKEQAIELYDDIYGNDRMANFIYNHWGDEKMIKTFPNLKIEDVNGKTIHVKQLLPHIKPYYFRAGD